MDDCSRVGKQFLMEFVNELSSATSEDFVNIGIGGNYSVKQEDISKEVIAFVLCYLEQRKFPHELTVYLAKKVAELFADVQVKDNGVEDDCPFPTAAALHVVAFDRLHKLCYQLLDQPQVIDEVCAVEKVLPFASVSAIKNKRRKMEDRHVVIHDMNSLFDLKDCPNNSYYAVFDGHGGIDAASYAAVHLHMNIIQHPEFTSDPTKAIIDAYKLTDMQFCERVSKEGAKSGCTAVSALIRNDTLYLAWLGDSQALLIKQGQPVTLMAPHTPDRQDERARIEGLGGFVCHVGTWRVNGTLAVSRALGDQEFKPYISSEPDVSEIHLDGTEDFLILACDGLWDGVTPEDASVTLYRTFCDSSDNVLDDVAKKLVDKSKQQGSDDNITAIVIFLRNAVDISSDALKYAVPAVDSSENLHETFSWNNSVCHQMSSEVEFLEKQNYIPERPKSLHETVSAFPCLRSDLENAVVGLPPEATVLSELPTPPIDDILKEQIPIRGQYVETLSSPFSKISSLQNDNYEQEQLRSPGCLEATNASLVQIPENDSQPVVASKEAVDVAANIVSEVIETAVTHVNSIKISDSAVDNVKNLDHDCAKTIENFDASNSTNEKYSQPEISSTILNGLDFAREPMAVPKQSEECSSLHFVESSVAPTPLVEAEMGKKLSPTDSSETDIDKVKADVSTQEANRDLETVGLMTQPSLTSDVIYENKSDVSLIDSACSKAETPASLAEPILEKTDHPPVDPAVELVLKKEVNLESNQSLPQVVPTKESVAVDDLQLAAVAIDLKAVPEFIPEAECVVEDYDSDSEKDGGWSYIKATNNDTSPLVSSNLNTPPSKECPPKNTPSVVKDKLKVPKPVQNAVAQSKSPVQSLCKKPTQAKTPRIKPLMKSSEEKKTVAKVTTNVAAKSIPSPAVSLSKAPVTELKSKTSTTARAVPKSIVKTPNSKLSQQTPRPLSVRLQKPSVPRAGTIGVPQNKEQVTVSTNKPNADGSTVKKSSQTQPAGSSKSGTLKTVPSKLNPLQGMVKPQKTVSANQNAKETKNNVNKLIVTETLAARAPPSKAGSATVSPRINVNAKDKSIPHRITRPATQVRANKVMVNSPSNAASLKDKTEKSSKETISTNRNLKKPIPKDRGKKDNCLSEPKTKKGVCAVKTAEDKRELKQKTDPCTTTKAAVIKNGQHTETVSGTSSECTSNAPCLDLI